MENQLILQNYDSASRESVYYDSLDHNLTQTNDAANPIRPVSIGSRDFSDAASSFAAAPNDLSPDERAVLDQRRQDMQIKHAIPSTQSSSSRNYNMRHKHRGMVIIYNHNTYISDKFQARNGTDQDVARLKATLPLLGFKSEDIIVNEDMVWHDIRKSVGILERDYEQKIQESDCIFVFILSHGEQDNRIMAHDRAYDLYEFVSLFTPDNFKELATKPKIFCVQACRGNATDIGVTIARRRDRKDSDQVDSPTDFYTHPIFADLFIAFSSHHNHYSFRNNEGSWFIQELCNIISECDLEDYNLNDIMTETNARVAKRVSANDDDSKFDKLKQVSTFSSSLVKNVYFKGQRQ